MKLYLIRHIKSELFEYFGFPSLKLNLIGQQQDKLVLI